MNRMLNPQLYAQLERAFVSVRVANEGQPMSASAVPNWGLPGRKLRLEISDWGETYCVPCPFCSDTRHRLWVNHRFGVRDSRTGDDMMFAAVCYNERCVSTRERQKQLHAMVYPEGRFAESAKDLPAVSTPVIPALPARAFTLPGTFVRLDRLPPDHPANCYLAARFYDPERLGRFYGVGYCVQSDFYMARNRIVAPVFQRRKLEGWQARYVGHLDWKGPRAPPKWWTCPGTHKSKLLYNLDNARRWQTGVVVEGAGDVWGFGPMAVATFGSSMSRTQEASLREGFGSQSLVMLWDPDVQADPVKKRKYDELVSGLRQAGFRGGVASVALPGGTDPGSLDRRFLREFVAREARGQGVTVSWKPKP